MNPEQRIEELMQELSGPLSRPLLDDVTFRLTEEERVRFRQQRWNDAIEEVNRATSRLGLPFFDKADDSNRVRGDALSLWRVLRESLVTANWERNFYEPLPDNQMVPQALAKMGSVQQHKTAELLPPFNPLVKT